MIFKSMILVAFVLAAFLLGMFTAEETDIICDANTEKLISKPKEYPAWTLECRDTNHRIIVID